MCSIYPYYSQGFNDSVYREGCHQKLQDWFDEQVIIFAVVGFSFAAFQIIGVCLSIIICRQIQEYSYIGVSPF
ncbi:hypothetical protein L596_003955 [Steinernema carpocapsae]|nr:hypothetical protein L596_003955 [Steinernema carpocapsae]